MDSYDNFIPVPEVFWSVEHGKPFHKCSLCDCDLFEEGKNYLIEKAIRGSECIFEYAMCMDCQSNMCEELSANSMKLIFNYFGEHVDINQRYRQCIEQYGTDVEGWISRCLIKDKPREQCEEYQLYGYFIDEDLVFNGMPYMLSSDVIEDLLGLLSNETLGILEDLSDRLFGIDLPQSVLLI